MKQYFTGFFTAVCLTASVFLFLGAQKQQFDDIIAKTISLVHEDGTQTIIGGKGAAIFNKNSQPIVLFGESDDGVTGFLTLYNDKGKEIVRIGNDGDGGGHLLTNNKYGEKTVYLGTDNERDGGRLMTFNNYGNTTSYLGTFDNGNGTLAVYNDKGESKVFAMIENETGSIITKNKYGNTSAAIGTLSTQEGVLNVYDQYGKEVWSISASQIEIQKNLKKLLDNK